MFRDLMYQGDKFVIMLLNKEILAKLGDLFLGSDSLLKGKFGDRKFYLYLNYENSGIFIEILSFLINFLQ